MFPGMNTNVRFVSRKAPLASLGRYCRVVLLALLQLASVPMVQSVLSDHPGFSLRLNPGRSGSAFVTSPFCSTEIHRTRADLVPNPFCCRESPNTPRSFLHWGTYITNSLPLGDQSIPDNLLSFDIFIHSPPVVRSSTFPP